MKLIVLASGRGKRLKKKTQKYPKCMTIVNNNRIIDYYDKIYDLFNEVIFVVGYKSKLIINYIKKKKLNHSKFVRNKKFKSTRTNSAWIKELQMQNVFQGIRPQR